MSGASSSAVGWFSLLESAQLERMSTRPDDPRLGEIMARWDGDAAALQPGRAVLIGFPQDEGVRRNGGRVGAAQAPDAIRRFLHRLTPCDAAREIDLAGCPPLDAGNVRVDADLEESQQRLGEVIAGVLRARSVPVVLGGGHETAFGHYLGYVNALLNVGIINIDAHLDVRPPSDGRGTSGTPFRQMLEHPSRPLAGSRYRCLGVQPSATAREHYRYAVDRGCKIWWATEIGEELGEAVNEAAKMDGPLMLTIDADTFAAAEVPGVSAPNPLGLTGRLGPQLAQMAGMSPRFSSVELVEINPRFDADDRSVRWAALTVWHFLIGLAQRAKTAHS